MYLCFFYSSSLRCWPLPFSLHWWRQQIQFPFFHFCTLATFFCIHPSGRKMNLGPHCYLEPTCQPIFPSCVLYSTAFNSHGMLMGLMTKSALFCSISHTGHPHLDRWPETFCLSNGRMYAWKDPCRLWCWWGSCGLSLRTNCVASGTVTAPPAPWRSWWSVCRGWGSERC